jgi:hypothetical protein
MAFIFKMDVKAAAARGFMKTTDTRGKKSSHHFKKASIPLRMCLKSLAVLEKASISQKKSLQK